MGHQIHFASKGNIFSLSGYIMSFSKTYVLRTLYPALGLRNTVRVEGNFGMLPLYVINQQIKHNYEIRNQMAFKFIDTSYS